MVALHLKNLFKAAISLILIKTKFVRYITWLLYLLVIEEVIDFFRSLDFEDWLFRRFLVWSLNGGWSIKKQKILNFLENDLT